MAAFRKSLALRCASLLLAPAADGGVGRPCRFLFLQKRPLFQRALPPDRRSVLLAGDRIGERVRSLNPCRICLDVILPPARSEAPALREEGEVMAEKKRVSLVEVRKLARASLVAVVRARLATVEESCIDYTEFVAKSIEKLIPSTSSHESFHTRQELKMLEEKKSEIDKQAAAQVRKELWLGLGFMVAQTAALMRVTFWELSWDVMEPICFFLTSVYFLSGYAFFLRTSKEPSFESFFASRFATKQRHLMKAQNFDLTHFNQLSRAFSHSLPPPPPYSKFASASCHCDRNN